MKKKLGYNLSSKIAGIILYFILCLLLLGSIVGTYFCLSFDIYANHDSYIDSRIFSVASKLDLDNIERMTINNNYINNNKYDKQYTNFRFGVYSIDFKQQEMYLWGNSDQKQENCVSFFSKNKMFNIYYGVDDNFSIDDDYYQNYLIFSFLVNFRFVFIATLTISFILSLVDLIYLGSVVGYNNKSDKPVLNIIDKIPLEILAILIASVIYLYISIARYFSQSAIASIVILLGLIFLISTNFLILVLTICSRSRHGIWCKNSYVYRLCSSLKDLYDNLAILYKTIIASILCFVLIPIGINMLLNDALASKIMFLYGICLAVMFIYQATKVSKIIAYTKQIVAGDYQNKIDEELFEGELKNYVRDLNQISDGMDKAVSEQLRSEKLKMELITNVSHDIKTPLTLILSYADLLKNKHTPGQRKQYLQALENATNRLKKMTDDVLEVSKANTGNVNVNLALSDINELLSQAVGEYQDRFTANGLAVNLTIVDKTYMLNTDGQIVWRILDNCFSNVCNYAVNDSRVYIESNVDDNYYNIIIKNVSSAALNVDANTLMERFVRGDKSRNSQGSGLGLNISSSLTKLINGKFEIKIDGDLFKVIVSLPLDN